MASITIHNLDDSLEHRLRIRATKHGRSMEEEAREILHQAIGKPAVPENLGEVIHRRFAALGGVELDLPPREAMPEPPHFPEQSLIGLVEAHAEIGLVEAHAER